MFVQVIEGHVGDGDGLRAQLDRWVEELGPTADGWLGTTSGIAGDGTFVALARFESEAAAQANSARPEQGEWWDGTAACFDGDVTFTNCPDVDGFGTTGAGAGFVQLVYGRADRDALLAMVDEITALLARVRPDVIGNLMAWPGDGTFVQAVYFTNEADARKGEQAEPAPEDAARFADLVARMEPTRFVDLTDPWIVEA